MRYLVFGDVHGNLPALEKMLSAENGNFDEMISHGDVVNYGPWSNECVELLNALNCICLKGNHEEYFLKGSYDGTNLIPKAFFEVCYPSFNKKHIIKGYISDYSIPGYNILHTINDRYIFPDSDVTNICIDRNTIIGHSHHQFSLQIKNCKLYNTGSVGQNRKFINVINYLVIDSEKETVNLKSLQYDVDIIINKMKELKYPQICLEYYLKKERV